MSQTRQRDALLGARLAGRYQIQRRIGEGGMGLVYLAEHIGLHRSVVVKTLHAVHGSDERALARFGREAHGLSQLDHPHIVRVYDFGTEGSVNYLVMEYIDGETLKDRINARGPMRASVFAPIAAQILDAVAQAHRQGLIHRDIKPSNIMLSERQGTRDFVTVLDFGLAKLLDSEEQTLTQHNHLVGTTAFMAPECMIDQAVVDQRVDVYALGVLFYIMLSGRRPFEGESVAVLYKHVHEPVPPLATRLPPGHDVPPALIDWIHRCLGKRPEERPFDAGVMLQELIAIVGDVGVRTSGEYPSLRESDSREIIYPGESTGELKMWPQTRQEHSATVEQPSALPSRAPLYVGAAVALSCLALGIAGAIMLVPGASTSETPSKTPKAVDPSASLDAVEARIQQERFAEASTLLDVVFGDARGDAALLARATSLKVRIEQGRAFGEAARLESDGKIEEALAIYQGVLHQDPRQETAQRESERLRAFASIEVSADRKAQVFLGDRALGETPVTARLPAGSHTFTLRAGSLTRELTISLQDRAVVSKSVAFAEKSGKKAQRATKEMKRKLDALMKEEIRRTRKRNGSSKRPPKTVVPLSGAKKPPRRVKTVIPLP